MQDVWISTQEAARRLCVDKKTVKKVVEAAGIRSRVLPGKSPRYVQFLAEDVDRVAHESIIDPGQVRGAVA